jgi:hypothetical protein
MKQQTRAILGIVSFGAWILGAMIILLCLTDIAQYLIGWRRIIWDREFVTLISGIVFFTFGYVGQRRLN